jgi:hypothetical protein
MPGWLLGSVKVGRTSGLLADISVMLRFLIIESVGRSPRWRGESRRVVQVTGGDRRPGRAQAGKEMSGGRFCVVC